MASATSVPATMAAMVPYCAGKAALPRCPPDMTNTLPAKALLSFLARI
jgi:hypothetical protein